MEYSREGNLKQSNRLGWKEPYKSLGELPTLSGKTKELGEAFCSVESSNSGLDNDRESSLQGEGILEDIPENLEVEAEYRRVLEEA